MEIIEHTSGLVPGPGIYRMPSALYHADPAPEPSLSASVAKILIDRTPKHAWAAHPRLGNCAPDKATREMDIGTVAHEMLLGHGGGYVVSPFDDYRTKEARAWRDEALARGLTPIRQADYDAARRIVEAVSDKMRSVLGILAEGWHELVFVWQEPDGSWMRSMLDMVTKRGALFDIKTRVALGDRAIRTWIGDGLDVQAAFHTRGFEALVPDMAGRAKWSWVFAEREEPNAVRVVEADATTMHMGRRKVAYAQERWTRCMRSGEWPAYPDAVETVEYATWAEAAWLERELSEASK